MTWSGGLVQVRGARATEVEEAHRGNISKQGTGVRIPNIRIPRIARSVVRSLRGHVEEHRLPGADGDVLELEKVQILESDVCHFPAGTGAIGGDSGVLLHSRCQIPQVQ